MTKPKINLRAAAALAIAIVVTGCSESPQAEQAGQTAPAPAVSAVEAPSMTAPLTQELVGAKYSIASTPVLAKNGGLIRTMVSVTNTGSVAINSNGRLPVHLAISLVNGAGEIVALDFVRASLPAEGIPAGGSADVLTEVPLKDVLGKSLRFGLVQEGVAWYTDFNVAPLDYGPLISCEDQGKQAICGKDNKPLPRDDSK